MRAKYLHAQNKTMKQPSWSHSKALHCGESLEVRLPASQTCKNRLTAHVNLFSDTGCLLTTAFLSDGSGALPSLKVRYCRTKPTIHNVCTVSLFVHCMEAVSCFFVELERASIISLDPLAGISTGEVGSVGDGGAKPL